MSTEGRTKKRWNIIYKSVTEPYKRTLPFVTTWMNLEDIMLSEIT